MLNRLLPRHVDNTYHGYKLALWLFAVLVFMKVGISLNAIFNGRLVASSADGIPLDTFTPAGAQAVVSLFAAWGLAQLTICLLCILALARYRALVPFMFALLLLEHLSRRLIFLVMPIVRTGTPPGLFVNLTLFALIVVGLALSLRSRAAGRRGNDLPVPLLCAELRPNNPLQPAALRFAPERRTLGLQALGGTHESYCLSQLWFTRCS